MSRVRHRVATLTTAGLVSVLLGAGCSDDDARRTAPATLTPSNTGGPAPPPGGPVTKAGASGSAGRVAPGSAAAGVAAEAEATVGGEAGKGGVSSADTAGSGGRAGSATPAGGAGAGGSGAGPGGGAGAGGGQAGRVGAGTGGAGGGPGSVGGAAQVAGGGGLAAVCPVDMVQVGSFCMDRYEAPNQPGADPLAAQTALEGVAWCEARGKRLCNETEWLRACQGAAKRTYPYGNTHVAHACNDDQTWRSPSWSTLGTWPSAAAKAEAARLYQADPSGSRSRCVSEEGVQDLTGNVAEWVVRTLPNANNHDHVMKGCYWAGCYGGTLPNCTFVNPAHPGSFRSYEAGFRCCLDP